MELHDNYDIYTHRTMRASWSRLFSDSDWTKMLMEKGKCEHIF